MAQFVDLYKDDPYGAALSEEYRRRQAAAKQLLGGAEAAGSQGHSRGVGWARMGVAALGGLIEGIAERQAAAEQQQALDLMRQAGGSQLSSLGGLFRIPDFSGNGGLFSGGGTSVTPSPPVEAAAPAAPSFSMDSGQGGRSMQMPVDQTALAAAIQKHASAAGLDPLDVATAMSYETAGTFDPWKAGPRTQWGQHRGLIQWGEPQAKQYGVGPDTPVDQQVGAAIKYLQDRGVQPGMGLMDIYSAINAGSVGRYGASDANNGGAPGTVADKVNTQMAGHRRKAQALLALASGQAPTQVASADPGFAPQRMAGLSVEPVQPGPVGVPPTEEMLRREQQPQQMAQAPMGPPPQAQLPQAPQVRGGQRPVAPQVQDLVPNFQQRAQAIQGILNSKNPRIVQQGMRMLDQLSEEVLSARKFALEKGWDLQRFDYELGARSQADLAKEGYRQQFESGETTRRFQQDREMQQNRQGFEQGQQERRFGQEQDMLYRRDELEREKEQREMARPRVGEGFQPQVNREGMVTGVRPLPGSKQEREMQDLDRKRSLEQLQRQTAGDLVVQDIDRTLGTMRGANLPTTGMGGSLLSNIPGTAAHDMSQLIQGIGANISLDKLQQMRQSSPTGGALGNVTEKEHRLLQSTLGSLEQSQTAQQFEFNLRRLKNLYLDIIHGPGNGPREELDSGDGGWTEISPGVRIRRKQ